MNQARFTHTIDSVLEDAVTKVATSDPDNAEGELPASVVHEARANPVLTRALGVIGQAVSRSADAITIHGVVDGVEDRNNAEAIKSARKMLLSLELALEIGRSIVDRTEESFGNPQLAGDPAKDRRTVAEPAHSQILSKPEDRGPDDLLGGNLEMRPSPTAAINPPGPAELSFPEPGRIVEGKPEEGIDYGPDEPPPAPGPGWEGITNPAHGPGPAHPIVPGADESSPVSMRNAPPDQPPLPANAPATSPPMAAPPLTEPAAVPEKPKGKGK